MQWLKSRLFFLIIFCLPFQFGVHFWPIQTYVSSFRVDYLSPTIYIVDVLILSYIVLNLKNIIRYEFPHANKKIWLGLGLLIFVNIWISQFNIVVVTAWLKILLYILCFSLLSRESNLLKKIRKPFLYSLVLILAIALIQALIQKSVGGPLYYLGERPISITQTNVAKIDLGALKRDLEILRPYSTFSHPNSLAGYLLVSLVILPIFTKSKLLRYGICLVILLSFSKAAILALVIVEILRLKFPLTILVGTLIGFTPMLRKLVVLPAIFETSFASRQYLLTPTINIINKFWLMGVGLKKFIPTLAQYLPGNQLSYVTLQPVHNTFLLIISEIGLIGLLMLYYLGKSVLVPLYQETRTKSYISKVFSVILITGSLDHYWWTLPQNQLIIALSLAILYSIKNEIRRSNHKH